MMADSLIPPGTRVRINDRITGFKNPNLVQLHVHLVGHEGTVRKHFRFTLCEDQAGITPVLFDKVIVDLNNGEVVSCEPDWIDPVT